MTRRILAAILFLVSAQIWAGEKKIFVFNWAEYMPEAVLEQFQEESGIQVVYTTYENNEAMYAKVKILKGPSYDLVFPSTYYVDRMRKEGLIQAIDKSRLTNFKNLDPALLNKPYDPDNQFSIPYLWGSTAIGVQSDSVDVASIKRFTDLWRPEFKNKVLLTDDLREVIGMGLKVCGHSCNETDPAKIEQAYKRLVDLMPNVRLFAADSPKQPFLNQEVTIGLIWNGEAFMAASEDPGIKYIYPEEGAMLWMDSMVIPKTAANLDEVYRFIDFLLRPEIAKLISEEIGYATPNKAGFDMLEPDVKQNKTVYPDAKTVEAGEFQTDVGEAILVYERFWEKLKAGSM